MEKKIFISSTYEDIINHRKEIWKVLEELPVTLLGMEKFGARKDAPLNTCLKEVAKSDIFIGIIAFRYGSVNRVSGKSFTRQIIRDRHRFKCL